MILPDVLVHEALDHLFKNGPTRWYLLSSTEPVVGPTGLSNITEPVGYPRVQVLPGDWPDASGRAVEVTVDLPDVPLGDDLGIFPYWALADSGVHGADDAMVPGQFDEPLVLIAGTNNISAPARIESPASLTDLP
jgi:hypothetical protein